MKQIQCELPLAGNVTVYRPGMNRLSVVPFTPIPVPETPEEAKQIKDRRYILLQHARRLVEFGAGGWKWFGEPEEQPRPVLEGPIPEDFPHKHSLIVAGFESLEMIPRSESELMKIRRLVHAQDGGRITPNQRKKAARDIIEALDFLASELLKDDDQADYRYAVTPQENENISPDME